MCLIFITKDLQANQQFLNRNKVNTLVSFFFSGNVSFEEEEGRQSELLE